MMPMDARFPGRSSEVEFRTSNVCAMPMPCLPVRPPDEGAPGRFELHAAAFAA